jgi:hypothetical protein
MSPVLARNGHPAAVLACLLVGEDRKWAAHAQIDANAQSRQGDLEKLSISMRAARSDRDGLDIAAELKADDPDADIHAA